MKQQAVLLFAGLDPSGGAGISADIETFSYHNITALPIITTLTAQNTQTFSAQKAIPVTFINQQLKLLLADVDYQAIKIGALANLTQIKWLSLLLKKQSVPVVLDPIVSTTSGGVFLDGGNVAALNKYLLPYVSLCTPNRAELSVLTAINDVDEAATKMPCEWVLVTDGAAENVEHRLYQHGQYVRSFYNDKLAHHYHGSGCTLASAITANLVLNLSGEEACKQALDYTYKTLQSAVKLGQAQLHPKRYLS